MKTELSPIGIIAHDERFVNSSADEVVAKAEVLQNRSAVVRQFLVRHLISENQAEQAHATSTCGNFLMFKRYANTERTVTLDRANFCKHPMCPVCAWRRHLKYAKLIDKSIEIGRYNYLYHLVLGVPNVDSLSKSDLMYLKERAVSFVRQKLDCKDYISNLEVVNHGAGLHPHLHMLINIPAFVKVSKEYIKEMSHKWMMHCTKKMANRSALLNTYDGFTFFITGITKAERDGVAQELTKYIVKGDFTSDDGETISTIARAIKGVRKMSSSGTFKENMSLAKKIVLSESDERLRNLSKYDYEYLIYQFINGKYERKPKDD